MSLAVMRLFILKLVFLAFAIDFCLSPCSAASNPREFLQKGQAEFNESKFNEAIKSYREYLRRFPRDADAWSQLAVAYYFIGDTDKALDFLRRWEPQTMARSYNQFYQGLIHVSLEKFDVARSVLARAAQFADFFAARAVFELAALEYKLGFTDRAIYWANQYRTRFPQGPAMPQIQKLNELISTGVSSPMFAGNKKPDLTEATYKYSPLSLSKVPNFWFARIGYDFSFSDEVQPDSNSDTGTKPGSSSNMDLIFHGGIGVGPLRQGQTYGWASYDYRQDWYTDEDRFNDYLNSGSFSDYFVYLPFRSDLMERTHRVQGKTEYRFGSPDIRLGLRVYQEYGFIGSSLIPSPDGDQVSEHSERSRESNLLMPYIEARAGNIWEGFAFLYFYKEINILLPELSNKTYNLFGEGDPVFSLGINNKFYFADYDLKFNLDAYMFEYIYNDYWQDFSRTSFSAGFDAGFEKYFGIYGRGGYYQDQYQLPLLRQSGCVFRRREAETGDEGPATCDHTDTGMLFEIGGRYSAAKTSQWKLSITYLENKNPTLTIYERTSTVIQFAYTYAFPNFADVSPFIEKHGDPLYSKEAY